MRNLDNVGLLMPARIRPLLDSLHSIEKAKITELRIRKDKPLVIMIDQNSYFLSDTGKLINHYTPNCICIMQDDFEDIFSRVSSYSVHSHIDSLINGYITMEDGNRAGIASSAVIKNGVISSVKDVSSLNIRIAKSIPDCARGVLNSLYVTSFPSIIIASPPSGGKTTFLRDFSRLLSSGFAGNYRKITIIDERCEFGPFDLGVNTDVLSAFPKPKGIEIAVRTLSPEMIICDEIANEEEVEKISAGFSSGVSFAVSVHVKSPEDLLKKSIVKKLIATGEFDYIVLLEDYSREFSIFDLRSCKDENLGDASDYCFFNIDRNITGS